MQNREESSKTNMLMKMKMIIEVDEITSEREDLF